MAGETTPTLLNLPPRLRQEAEQWANEQGISLDQLIVWALAEKLGALKSGVDDPGFPLITYRRGASGWPTPILRGTGIRVQTIVLAFQDWKMTVSEIAEDYDLTESQVQEALAFYEAHRGEVEASIADERQLEPANA